MLTVRNRLSGPRNPGLEFAFAPLAGVDRLFDELFPGFGGANGSGAAPWAWWEDDAGVHLEVELPGVKKEELELVVHQGQLHLKCERKAPEEGRQYRYNDRCYGKFERTIALPESIDTENVQAEMRDGVLYVTLSKRPEAQPKRITVQVG